jgi:hypothetical protein
MRQGQCSVRCSQQRLWLAGAASTACNACVSGLLGQQQLLLSPGVHLFQEMMRLVVHLTTRCAALHKLLVLQQQPA